MTRYASVDADIPNDAGSHVTRCGEEQLGASQLHQADDALELRSDGSLSVRTREGLSGDLRLMTSGRSVLGGALTLRHDTAHPLHFIQSGSWQVTSPVLCSVNLSMIRETGVLNVFSGKRQLHVLSSPQHVRVELNGPRGAKYVWLTAQDGRVVEDTEHQEDMQERQSDQPRCPKRHFVVGEHPLRGSASQESNEEVEGPHRAKRCFVVEETDTGGSANTTVRKKKMTQEQAMRGQEEPPAAKRVCLMGRGVDDFDLETAAGGSTVTHQGYCGPTQEVTRWPDFAWSDQRLVEETASGGSTVAYQGYCRPTQEVTRWPDFAWSADVLQEMVPSFWARGEYVDYFDILSDGEREDFLPF